MGDGKINVLRGIYVYWERHLVMIDVALKNYILREACSVAICMEMEGEVLSN